MKRRPIPGSKGGRPITHPFFFAPHDGDLYPSESPVIQGTRLAPPPEYQGSWLWAMSHARLNNMWIVVPLASKTPVDQSAEAKSIRSSVGRARVRLGEQLTSQRWRDAVYFTPIDQ